VGGQHWSFVRVNTVILLRGDGGVPPSLFCVKERNGEREREGKLPELWQNIYPGSNNGAGQI